MVIPMPRSAPQSALRYPLTWMLGTEANVRLLRELSRHGGQLSAPSLIVRTGLAKTSVWAGLAVLAKTGVISVAGTGRARLYSIRSQGLLRTPLDALFDAEEQRFNVILAAIRDASRVCRPAPMAVWLFGSMARGQDGPGSDLDVAILAARTLSEAALGAIRDALRRQEDELGFVASVVGLSLQDVTRLSATRDPWWTEVIRDAVPLLGPRPDEVVRRSGRAGRGRAAA